MVTTTTTTTTYYTWIERDSSIYVIFVWPEKTRVDESKISASVKAVLDIVKPDCSVPTSLSAAAADNVIIQD